MANPFFKDKEVQSRLTFIFALSAFLIVLIITLPDVISFYEFKEWGISDWLLFFQLLVIAISAYIAFNTIQSTRDRSRERATLDTILKDNSDIELARSKTITLNFDKEPYKFLGVSKEDFYIKYKREPCTSLSELCEFESSKLTDEESNVRRHLMHVLNRHEFYAIGVNTCLMDEVLFKRLHCTSMIKLWEVVNPAVTHLRSKSQKATYYKDLELLALRWKESPLTESDLKK
ncbi:DUF4760 domain-containing protein [Acinetobacter sp. WCHAc010052]|uniref:DUF4760 domain-containing protein n=1 Tax=Acinetobacter sp. WCHAc010052 TaxID=2004647 RepID=UPI000B3CD6CE|nr:DUF4760 domain-containing protein [Acinetobacter sp. WCHAc010052]AXY60187.1 DUF4760 domain-containing protein [Acinetobacter sp. WCHAc010052]